MFGAAYMFGHHKQVLQAHNLSGTTENMQDTKDYIIHVANI